MPAGRLLQAGGAGAKALRQERFRGLRVTWGVVGVPGAASGRQQVRADWGGDQSVEVLVGHGENSGFYSERWEPWRVGGQTRSGLGFNGVIPVPLTTDWGAKEEAGSPVVTGKDGDPTASEPVSSLATWREPPTPPTPQD